MLWCLWSCIFCHVVFLVGVVVGGVLLVGRNCWDLLLCWCRNYKLLVLGGHLLLMGVFVGRIGLCCSLLLPNTDPMYLHPLGKKVSGFLGEEKLLILCGHLPLVELWILWYFSFRWMCCLLLLGYLFEFLAVLQVLLCMRNSILLLL